jgi:hypothetical protein
VKQADPVIATAVLLTAALVAWTVTIRPELPRILHDTREEMPAPMLSAWWLLLVQPGTRRRTAAGTIATAGLLAAAAATAITAARKGL